MKFHMIRRLCVTALLATGAVAGEGDQTGIDNAQIEKVRGALERPDLGLTVESVEASDVPGLYTVQLVNGPVAYATTSGYFIVGDLRTLLNHVQPPRPVLVGLSIGGLYAAKAYLAGEAVAGLVLINTLRRITPRLAWMNDATVRAMQVGGPDLMKDLLFHLLVGEQFQEAHRNEFLKPDTKYEPLPEDSGAFNLLTWMGKTDWNIDWSKLDCPVLLIQGQQDRIFYDPPIVAELTAKLPNAISVNVPEAGHMLPMEVPDAFLAALDGFPK